MFRLFFPLTISLSLFSAVSYSNDRSKKNFLSVSAGTTAISNGIFYWFSLRRRYLGAFSLSQKRVLWKVSVSNRNFQFGTVSLHPVGERLFLYAGKDLGVFSSAGKLIKIWSVPEQRSIYYPDGCEFFVRKGVCALSCGDRFQLLDCRDGSTLGPPYYLAKLCVSPQACHVWRGRPYGWFGPLALFISGLSVRNRMQFIAAFSVDRGKIIWKQPIYPTLFWLKELSLWDEGADLCWIVGLRGAVKVFLCRKGKVLWKMGNLPAPIPGFQYSRLFYLSKKLGVFVSIDREMISLIEPYSGAILWRKSFSPGEFGILPDTPFPQIHFWNLMRTQFRRFVIFRPYRNKNVDFFSIEPKGTGFWDTFGRVVSAEVEGIKVYGKEVSSKTSWGSECRENPSIWSVSQRAFYLSCGGKKFIYYNGKFKRFLGGKPISLQNGLIIDKDKGTVNIYPFH